MLVNTSSELNISRVQLEEAVRKWENKQVIEYKMVVEAKPGYPLEDLSGVWSVTVNDGQAQITNGPYQRDVNDMWFLTVGGQFSEVNEMLMEREKGLIDKRFSRSVSFDPNFGYPKSIEIAPKLSSEPWLLFFGERSSIRVTNLQILSSAAPNP